jgi:hypothetical protein
LHHKWLTPIVGWENHVAHALLRAAFTLV